jgi:hypothetical protein
MKVKWKMVQIEETKQEVTLETKEVFVEVQETKEELIQEDVERKKNAALENQKCISQSVFFIVIIEKK